MGGLHTGLPQSNDRPHQERKKIQPGAATTRKRKDAEAASNHCYSPVNAGWTEVSAPPGSLPHEPEQLGTFVDQLSLPAPFLQVPLHVDGVLSWWGTVDYTQRSWKLRRCDHKVLHKLRGGGLRLLTQSGYYIQGPKTRKSPP